MSRKIMGRSLILAAGIFAGVFASQSMAQSDSEPIRIGYAVSISGPYAGAASSATLAPYRLWLNDVNAAGGIKVGGKTRKVEMVEYDDRSSPEEAVRAIERLINQDKVDFILPPWGTALNLAVGGVLDRNGFPHLAVTAITDLSPVLRDRWKRSFFFMPQSRVYAEGIVDMLADLREQGAIKGAVALLNVADQFGIEMANAARKRLKEKGFDVVVDQSYPLGSQDMQSIVNQVRRAQPEVLLGFSYAPDAMAITEQAKALAFNPSVFYLAVGPALPVFKGRFGDSIDGVMGGGGIDASSEQIQAFLERHKAVIGHEADRWSAPITYASLQVLQQAIERAGTLDRSRVAEVIATGKFDTIVGEIQLDNRIYTGGVLVGQWQGGEFQAIAPADHAGAKQAVHPKPAWK